MDASMNVKRSGATATVCMGAMIAIAMAAPAAWAQASGKADKSAKADNKGDKIMSRDELRACMKQSDTLKAGTEDLERNRKTLDTEKADLAKEREALDEQVKAVAAERETVDKADEAAVKAYNDKANAMIATYNTRKPEIDAKVDGWNAKNRALVERAQAQDQSSKSYNESCVTRRFREDDEKAIRAGK
jgi:predicted RNase H-like nuclease (RuvC/YqgF family)